MASLRRHYINALSFFFFSNQEAECVSSMGVKRPKNERVVRIKVRRGALNRGFFSPTRTTKKRLKTLTRFCCLALVVSSVRRRARDVFVLPEKTAKMFSSSFEKTSSMCVERSSLRSDALSLSFERARACANAQQKGFRGLKNTRKNMCFLYLYLFLTKTPQRASRGCARSNNTWTWWSRARRF